MAPTSNETIFTYKRNGDDDNMSDWSMVWSTTHVPGMDMATGAGSSRRRKSGRRRLRITALTVGCMLTMHVRVSAAALCGGYFVFLLLLLLSVALLANPLRHFEVYLGQWSLSGPGRAFRIIPSFEGIGIAICIHAIMRAIISVVLAAVGLIYIVHTTSDRRLPFSYCRNMKLEKYKGAELFVDTVERIERLARRKEEVVNSPYKVLHFRRTNEVNEILRERESIPTYSKPHIFVKSNKTYELQDRRRIILCKETYPNNYPPIFKTPPYNYFYVEVVHYRPKITSSLNIPLLVAIMVVWFTLWMLMVMEKFAHARIIWNNMYQGFIIIPWIWAALLIFCGAMNFFSRTKPLRNVFHVGGHKELLDFVTDSFMVATYIHAAGLGSELIIGKGLNFYASGHVDPLLDGENVWHSAILLMMTALSTGGATFCTLTDYMHMRDVNNMQESTLWVFPMISKCALGPSINHYSHLSSTLLFSGLVFSYVTIAFVCLKTALHIIFEYKVKLVFIEQVIVGLLIVGCMCVSVLFTTDWSLGLLESIDVCLAGIATPLICALEMFGFLCVYQSHDFISDMNISTEENTCSSRIGIMWQVAPFIHMVLFIMEAILIANSELPGRFLWMGAGAVVLIIIVVPIRACHNAYNFMQPPKKAGAAS